MNVLAALDWTDPATIGYPALGVGVLVGSIVPVVPTGAVVGAAAAIAMTTGRLWLPAVIGLATVAALAGDLVTFAADVPHVYEAIETTRAVLLMAYP